VKLKRAAFLDRDGVINEDHGYVYRAEDMILIDGVVQGLQLLASYGFLLVIVTNQSGIARGYYTEGEFREVTRSLLAELGANGIQIAHVAHCPHLPTEQQLEPRCRCRKPRPGMILDAAALLDIDLSRSVMIGDKRSDMQAGHSAGVGRCYFIGNEMMPLEADAIFPDLLACARQFASDSGAAKGDCSSWAG
jgi:D-glycero-D-manno-heptose 1,7-bisphosphate phosphatase